MIEPIIVRVIHNPNIIRTNPKPIPIKLPVILSIKLINIKISLKGNKSNFII